MTTPLVPAGALATALDIDGAFSAAFADAVQRPQAEAALDAVRRFVGRVGQKGLGTPLTRDELARALAARSDATLEALRYDLACFARYCAAHGVQGLPAAHETVARYVEQLSKVGPVQRASRVGSKASRPARPLRPVSIARRLASIGMVHKLLRLPNPCADPNVKNALVIVRRAASAKQRQALGLRLAVPAGQGHGDRSVLTLDALLEACDTSLGGLRDAALIAAAYDGGFRVSELTQVRLGDLAVMEERDGTQYGVVTLRRSKTDQLGEGAKVRLYPDTLRRVHAWIAAAGIEGEGNSPLFRRVQAIVHKARKGRAARYPSDPCAIPPRPVRIWHEPAPTGLSSAGVRLIFRRTAQRAADLGLVDLSGEALDQAVRAISTHSMRVGLAQDLRARGTEDSDIMGLLRWKDPKSLRRYVENLPASDSPAVQWMMQARG